MNLTTTYTPAPQASPPWTCLRAETRPLAFERVRAVLGEPRKGDGYKVSSEWVVTDALGRVFTVYDYKETNLYDSELPSVAAFRRRPYSWHIGAAQQTSDADVRAFKDWLEGAAR